MLDLSDSSGRFFSINFVVWSTRLDPSRPTSLLQNDRILRLKIQDKLQNSKISARKATLLVRKRSDSSKISLICLTCFSILAASKAQRALLEILLDDRNERTAELAGGRVPNSSFQVSFSH